MSIPADPCRKYARAKLVADLGSCDDVTLLDGDLYVLDSNGSSVVVYRPEFHRRRPASTLALIHLRQLSVTDPPTIDRLETCAGRLYAVQRQLYQHSAYRVCHHNDGRGGQTEFVGAGSRFDFEDVGQNLVFADLSGCRTDASGRPTTMTSIEDLLGLDTRFPVADPGLIAYLMVCQFERRRAAVKDADGCLLYLDTGGVEGWRLRIYNPGLQSSGDLGWIPGVAPGLADVRMWLDEVQGLLYLGITRKKSKSLTVYSITRKKSNKIL